MEKIKITKNTYHEDEIVVSNVSITEWIYLRKFLQKIDREGPGIYQIFSSVDSWSDKLLELITTDEADSQCTLRARFAMDLSSPDQTGQLITYEPMIGFLFDGYSINEFPSYIHNLMKILFDYYKK